MGTIRAITVTPDAMARLAVGSVPAPEPTQSELLVRVAAISLNRGEVRRVQNEPKGTRPGWDLAGTVERMAADGSGPPIGSRVVGLVSTGSQYKPGVVTAGAWAEIVAVPSHAVAMVPDSVSFVQAATLPVAGLTALMGLEKAGGLLGRNVLITGASGGVGDFAIQFARDMGARVVALVRSEERAGRVREAGAHVVVIGDDARAASTHGLFHLVFDGVGSDVLAGALKLLSPDGLAVTYGRTAGETVTFELGHFFLTGGLRLYGFLLFHELRREPASEGLARLAALVAADRLHPHVSVEASWTEIGAVAQRLLDRDYGGKAVLHVD